MASTIYSTNKVQSVFYSTLKVEVARISPDGVVSWGDDLSRGGGGSMEKVAEGRYSLRLFSARPSDSGVYRCAVSVYAGKRNPGPSAPATITQRSDGVTVNLKTKGERLCVYMQVWMYRYQADTRLKQYQSISLQNTEI